MLDKYFCVVGLCCDQIRYNLNMFGNIIEKLSYRREMNRGRDWLDVKPGLNRAKQSYCCDTHNAGAEINYIRTDKMTGTDLLEFLYFGQNCSCKISSSIHKDSRRKHWECILGRPGWRWPCRRWPWWWRSPSTAEISPRAGNQSLSLPGVLSPAPLRPCYVLYYCITDLGKVLTNIKLHLKFRSN